MPAKSPGTSTRERIIDYLSENQQASAQSLSRSWGLTRADIRYHLNGLAQDGLIEIVPRPTGRPVGRGRPVQYYRLKPESAPHNLVGLCDALLTVLAQSTTPDTRDQFFTLTARQLAGGNTQPASPVQRLNEAVRFLNQRGYHARWEASAAGSRFILRGCPYAALLRDHPEICEIDRRFLETLTGITFRQDARINLQTGKPPACVFSPEWVRV